MREVDYAAARAFWHPDIVIFGTYQELVKSLSAWTERQWDNVWPRTAEFRFDLANTMVMAAPDGAIAIAIAPWTSTGFHEDGMAFDRPGRATIVLARQPDGRWLLDVRHKDTPHEELAGPVEAPNRWITLRAARVLNPPLDRPSAAL